MQYLLCLITKKKTFTCETFSLNPIITNFSLNYSIPRINYSLIIHM